MTVLSERLNKWSDAQVAEFHATGRPPEAGFAADVARHYDAPKTGSNQGTGCQDTAVWPDPPGYHGFSPVIMNDVPDTDAADLLSTLLGRAARRASTGQDECLIEDAATALDTLAQRLNEARQASGAPATPIRQA